MVPSHRTVRSDEKGNPMELKLHHVNYSTKDVGAVQAATEERVGSKTDDDYARDAELRREARAEIREKELEEKKKIERERKELEAENCPSSELMGQLAD